MNKAIYLSFVFVACESSSLSGNWHVTQSYPENLLDSTLSFWEPEEITDMALNHSMELEEHSSEEFFLAYDAAFAFFQANMPSRESEEGQYEDGAIYLTGLYEFGFHLSGRQESQDAQSSTFHLGEIFVVDRRNISSAGPRPLVEVTFVGVGEWYYSYRDTLEKASKSFSGSYNCTGDWGAITVMRCSKDAAEELSVASEIDDYVQFELSR